MESTTRTIAKTASWQMLGLLSMALIGYVFTGSFLTAGSLALVTALSGTICYVMHERVWNRIAWGRLDGVPRASR